MQVLKVELVGICRWESGNSAGGYMQVGSLGVELVSICRLESGS